LSDHGHSRHACNPVQMASVPPQGETQTVKTTAHNEDSQITGAHMVQLEDLKGLLSSFKALLKVFGKETIRSLLDELD